MSEDAASLLLAVDVVGFASSVEMFRGATDVVYENVAGGTEVVVPVRYTGPGISGTVTDDAGARVPGVSVGLYVNQTMDAESVTSSDGSFLFIDVDPGQYSLAPLAPDQRTVCPAGRDVNVPSPELRVAVGFALRAGTCTWRVLVISGGDVDDTDVAVAGLAGDPNLSVERFFLLSTLPSLDFLVQYDVLLLYQNGLFDDSSPLGSRIAEYVASGGNVVIGSFYWQGRSDSGLESPGWGALEGIDPFSSVGGATYRAGDLGSTAPHPLTAGVGTIRSTGLWGGVSARPSTTVVAYWADDESRVFDPSPPSRRGTLSGLRAGFPIPEQHRVSAAKQAFGRSPRCVPEDWRTHTSPRGGPAD